jgi:hypothetical protein
MYFERWFSLILRMIGIKSFISGLPVRVMKRLCKQEERDKAEEWKSKRAISHPTGSHTLTRFWKKFRSQDTGCRIGKDGQAKKTFQSRFINEETQVKLWSQRQMQGGFELCITDLADEFILILESTEYELTHRQRDQGCLTMKDATKLKLVSDRLEFLTGEKSRENMKYLKARLGCVCNLVQRMPGNVVPFTAPENEMIIKLSWQGWDWLVDIIARGSVERLDNFVSQAEKMIENRDTIAVIAQDAVPVYLDLSTGRLMRKPDDGPNQDDIILTWCPSS